MKLIDLLVQELPKRGGWPDGAIYICTEKDGTPRIVGPCWHDNKSLSSFKINDDKSIIYSDQYESALEASEGWIEWHGGECPVDSDAIVEVKFRWHNPRQYNNDRAGDFYWAHTGGNADIIAYRLHDQSINSRANDDQLEQDLNECIGQDIDPTWNGDGLPPVGTICEAKVPRSITVWEWREVKVVESGIPGAEKEVLVYDLETTFPSWADEFRTLRTEAEKLRDEAGLALYHAINWNAEGEMVSPSRMEDYKKAYDAISAGKIPGVKLEGK